METFYATTTDQTLRHIFPSWRKMANEWRKWRKAGTVRTAVGLIVAPTEVPKVGSGIGVGWYTQVDRGIGMVWDLKSYTKTLGKSINLVLTSFHLHWAERVKIVHKVLRLLHHFVSSLK